MFAGWRHASEILAEDAKGSCQTLWRLYTGRLMPDGSVGHRLEVTWNQLDCKVFSQMLKGRFSPVQYCQDGKLGGVPQAGENGGAKLDHRAANRSCFWAE